MQKSFFIWMTLLIVLFFAASSLFNYFSFQRTIRHLQHASEELNSSLIELRESSRHLDSIKKELTMYQSYLKDVRQRVEYMDLQHRLKEGLYTKQRDSLLLRINQLKKELDLTGSLLPSPAHK